MAFVGSTPELFKKWLKDTLVRFKPFSKEENLVLLMHGMSGQKVIIWNLIKMGKTVFGSYKRSNT